MTDRRAVGMLRHVGDAARVVAPDAALLAWFAAERDEAAFAELVRRHGPTVLGVCRRVTRHAQDAEDAFQAVFLVLATKAGALARPELLGNWLYGVAYRVARRARRSAARRRAREGQVATMPEPVTQAPEPVADLAAVIDDALAELPERFRAAVLLCDLHELPRSEAATRLGIPEGTLSSRLATGRKKLADRLARHGMTAPAAGLAAVLGGPATAVPPGLATRAVSAAVAWASGGVVPAVLRQLATEGGVNMTRAIAWATVACAAMGLAVGAVAAWPVEKPQTPVTPAGAAKASEGKQERPDPKPEGVGNKPAVTTKPRLVKTFELTGRTEFPVWSPDGVLLAVEAGESVTIYDTHKMEVRTTLITGQSPHGLGFLADRPVFVTHKDARFRINASSQLLFWEVGRDKPVRTTELDSDVGYPFAVLPDGKAVLASSATRRQEGDRVIPVSTVYRVVDAVTGEPVRDVARTEGEPAGVGLSPDGKLLVAIDTKPPTSTRSGVTSGRVVVESWDVATGEKRWVRELDTGPSQGNSYVARPVVHSPDGKLLAVTIQAPRRERPASRFNSEIWLLDAATGHDGPRLEGQATDYNAGMSLSHDGRLLVGVVSDRANGNFLRVWDTRTGQVRKSWQGRGLAAFAPDRPVLAILEDTTDGEKGPPKSVLGFWDVSAPVK